MWIDGLTPFGMETPIVRVLDICIRHQSADGLNATTPERHARSVLCVAATELYDRRCVFCEFEVPVVKTLSPVERGESVFLSFLAGGDHVEPLALQD